MKKNRFIPYGYTMRNGKLVIEQSEAAVIRQIYEQYVNGASLKDIAEGLTGSGIPYSEKNTDWGKARVARIIDNERYLGNEEYDKIVDDSLFQEAVAAKKARQASFPGTLNSELSVVRSRIHCGVCGYSMIRKYSKKYKTGSVWFCANPDCHCKVGLRDEDLLERIMKVMSLIRTNERLLEPAPKERKSEWTDSALVRDFNDHLSGGLIDEERIARLINEIAGEEYAKVDPSSEYAAEELKSRIRRIGIREGFDPDLFKALVKSVHLSKNGIAIITSNNIKIGEDDGSQEDPEENGYYHPAER